MRRVLFITVMTVTAVCSGLSAGPARAAIAQKPAMRIASISATPHVVIQQGTVTFRVHVDGLTLDIRHMGKKAVSGHGHLQYYLDRIPSDAYTRKDSRHSFIAAVPTPVFTFTLKASPVRIAPGKHRILVALARNDDILYHAPVASVAITVR